MHAAARAARAAAAAAGSGKDGTEGGDETGSSGSGSSSGLDEGYTTGEEQEAAGDSLSAETGAAAPAVMRARSEAGMCAI